LAGIGSPPEPVNTQNTPGSLKKIEEEIVINLKTSKEIYTLFGETAQVGSRKYKIDYFLNK